MPEGEPLREVFELLAPDVAERVIFDLGLVRTLGYYTGPVFEVYDAAFGSPLGGGGRYDDLLGPLRPLAAGRGWALDVERVHAPCWGRPHDSRCALACFGSSPGARSRGAA